MNTPTGSNTMNDKTQATADATGLFKFRGKQFIVFEQNDIQYVALRGLVDLVGLQWKTARQTATNGDNVHLYGTCVLKKPEFAGLPTPRGSENVVAIRLDRVHMFLARVNTNQVRVHGDNNTADELLALQMEWAEVLFLYESGERVSKAELSDERSLVTLINAQKNCTAEQRASLSALITRKLKQMGGLAVPQQTELEV